MSNSNMEKWLAPETNNPISFEQMVTNLAKSGEDILKTMTPEQAHLMHMNWGVGGEVGELSDALKKYVIYNKELDLVNVIEELGDVEFYLEGLRQGLGITRQDTLNANKKKLLTAENARYKDGTYTDEQAVNRNDKQPVTGDTEEKDNTVFIYSLPTLVKPSEILAIATHFECTQLLKNWDFKSTIMQSTLVILSEDCSFDPQGLYLKTGNCVVPFSTALKLAGVQ
jgi:NTP pyrophosphatase (non-canonical NTP hydrolase)